VGGCDGCGDGRKKENGRRGKRKEGEEIDRGVKN
jgi:hypothetical protein